MNKPRLAALSVAALLAGISAALAGSATSRDNANPPAVTAQSGDALTLSDTQRKMAWQDLYMDSLNQNTPPGFDAIVGAKVPNTIVIAPVTAQAGSDVPVLKPYSFAMVQKKLVIVNPSNREIANVIAQ